MDDISRKLFQKACDLIPGGVNSPVRACRNVESEPLFIEHASGANIFDVDGKKYVDFVLSWGPMLLGHAEPSVTAALEAAAKKGASFGAPCPAEVELAERVTDAIPGVEMIRMVNSGTEATMSALRLARGITGRKKFVKFSGCYHGHADAFLAAAGSGVATLAIHGSPGVPDAVVADTLIAPYNDLNAVTTLFSKYGNDIAAITVEPVAANMGLVPPLPDFLEGLRQLADEYRALLIFDEVITGFRLAYGGAQTRFAIEPDLTTLGKIIGGGLPVGAFCGKKKYMEHVAPAGDIYQAGTLSGNPLAMASGIATLDKLKIADYTTLESRTTAFVRKLGEILRSKGVQVQTPSIASMFTVFFSPTPVANFEQAKACDQKLFTAFYKQMRQNGIYWPPSQFETCMVSFAHTDDDFQQTLEAASKVSF